MKLLFNLLLTLSCFQSQGQITSYNIGDQWTYQYEDYTIGGGNGTVNVVIGSIKDTLRSGSYLKYIFGEQDTFYVENGRIFYWGSYYEEFIMQFDYNSTTQYDIKYFDFSSDADAIATVVVDSISFIDFGDESVKVQHINILNSGTFEGDYYMDVYAGIGPCYGGRQFKLGKGWDDSVLFQWTSHIRCFSNEEMTYNFVDVACDSTWLVTDVDDVAYDELIIYPNPSTGELFIDELDNDIEYQIFSIDGKLLSEGITEKGYLYIKQRGVMILRLRFDEGWMFKKIIRIE